MAVGEGEMDDTSTVVGARAAVAVEMEIAESADVEESRERGCRTWVRDAMTRLGKLALRAAVREEAWQAAV